MKQERVVLVFRETGRYGKTFVLNVLQRVLFLRYIFYCFLKRFDSLDREAEECETKETFCENDGSFALFTFLRNGIKHFPGNPALYALLCNILI